MNACFMYTGISSTNNVTDSICQMADVECRRQLRLSATTTLKYR